MPIFDVSLVSDQPPRASAARLLADALGEACSSPAGSTWVRLHRIALDDYAENLTEEAPRPVFVDALFGRPPTAAALGDMARAICAAVAQALGIEPTLVHVTFAPAGAGRVTFGGVLPD